MTLFAHAPPAAVKRSAAQARAFRIAPGDSNYFALLFEPSVDGVDAVVVVEIFTRGGRTPPNSHAHAHEFFYVLAGEGEAHADGAVSPLRQGDCLMLRPGCEHVIANTGAGKLYTLTIMQPDEGLAELILAGEPVSLDAEDRQVLSGLAAI